MILLKTDKLIINLLFLTSLLIFIQIGPVSLSFPFGVLALMYFTQRLSFKLFSSPILWLTVIFITGVISSLLSEIPFISNLYFIIQFIYWLLLACMIGELYPYIDKKALSRVLLWGSVILGAVYLLLGLGTQNSVAFSLVVISPLGLYSLKRNIYKVLYSLLLLFYMFLNDSRTGFVILMVEMLFIYSHLFHIRNLKIMVSTVLVAMITVFITPLHTQLGNLIEPYNTDVGYLLKDPDAVFHYDKSWIQRKVQIQKGIQIFKEHPIIGIGPNNFSKVYVDIDVSNMQDVDPNALIQTIKNSDYRSTHNSYITLLSEFGLIGLVAFIVFILLYLKTVFIDSKRFDEFEFLLFVCTIGMCVYFYTIAAFYGTAAWLFYGLIYGFTRLSQINRR